MAKGVFRKMQCNRVIIKSQMIHIYRPPYQVASELALFMTNYDMALFI